MRIRNPFKRNTEIIENKALPNTKMHNSNLVTEEMIIDATKAEAIYANKSPWLYEDKSNPLQGTNLGAVIASEVARLITIESEISVDNDDTINTILQERLIPNLRDEIEKGWALGGLVLKPYYRQATLSIDKKNNTIKVVNGDLKIDFIYPAQFIINQYDNSGRILDIFIFTIEIQDNEFYTLVERQFYDESSRMLTITNNVYRSKTQPTPYKWDDIGVELEDIAKVSEFKNIQPKIMLNNVDGCLIGFYKPAVANHTNINSPYGCSPLIRAAESIRRADVSQNTLDWEIETTQTRLFIDSAAIMSTEETLPKKLAKIFVKIVGRQDNDPLIDKFSPEIRVEQYLKKLNNDKRSIEDDVGLAHGTISDASFKEQTRAEIITTKQRTYATVKDNQRSLMSALRQLGHALQVWLYLNKEITPLEWTFNFDDSVINDPGEQLTQWMQMQTAGNIPRWYVNVKRLGCSEDEAKRLVAESAKENFERMNDDYEKEFE